MSRGIVFLANDNVYDLAIAFLNSLRTVEPWLPLCFIPFDDDTKAIRRLASKYRFDTFDDTKRLQRCDNIGKAFHGVSWGHYRKLVAWECTFDEFIYIDVDTVVLHELSCVFRCLATFDYVLASSRMSSTRRWVWKSSVSETQLLSSEQVDYAANTGVICSRHRLLSLDIAEEKLREALQVAAHMELLCFEQPFLNYLIVTSGRRYTSLSELRRSRAFPSLPTEVWAGTGGGAVHGGKITFPRRRNILLVHWAGQWRLKSERDKAHDDPSNGALMPYESLWRFYREFDHQGAEGP